MPGSLLPQTGLLIYMILGLGDITILFLSAKNVRYKHLFASLSLFSLM